MRPECESRLFCISCRARTATGERFRASFHVLVGAAQAEFDCPHGIAWGFNGPPAAGAVGPRSLPLVPRTPREVEACLAACVGCEHEQIHDYEVPGCKLVTGCCGSQSPLAFKKYVESGAPCRHPAGDRHAAAVRGLHELEAAVKSD